MEKNDLKKVESLQIVSLQKEVQELKDTLEVKSLKEETVARILLEQDRAVVTKIAKAVRQIVDPGKEGDSGGTSGEGNG
jgi:hypothetical protein